MALIRAVVVHRHVSGLPRDNVVNTFHFQPLVADAAAAESIAEAVRDFYVGPPADGVATPLMEFFGASVATTGHEVRMYPIDPADGLDARGEGFPPIHVEAFDHIGRAAQPFNLPTEVAVCLSMRNMSLPNVPLRRRRGRIYFGPLKDTVDTKVLVAGVTRPAEPLLVRLRLAGQTLSDRAHDLGAPWSIFSRPYAGRDLVIREGRPPLPALPARGGAAYGIDELWTDDAFDTQRRRGERATGRVIVAAP